MAVILGGVTFEFSPVIENEFAETGVDAQVEKALDGAPLVYEQVIFVGDKFDLVGGSDFAPVKRSALKSIQSLAMVPNAQYTLNYEGENSLVRFRNEDPPAVSADPIRPVSDPDDNAYYKNLRIKLMRIQK